MKVAKVLNNNAVIIKDGDLEKIAIGAGIGFHKRKNDPVNLQKIEKLFVLEDNKKLEQLLMRIPEEHFILSEEIIAYAEAKLHAKLNSHVLLALSDHISFAIERESQGIHLQNKLLQEIKILYRDEFEIGLWALDHIKEKLGLEMPVDEAAFIALHIHTMKIQGGDLHETIRETTIIRDMVEVIKQTLGITIKEEDLAYERLITHLRFAVSRAKQYEVHAMDEEMLQMIRRKFKIAYECALQVNKQLSEVYGFRLPEEELGYITLHIERLRKY
ncbi:PRD domain-containing protein [Virgibacillus sp. 179-BFC.A HS]|uniref:PRD domain-containing protein n=1 Tax=Tigheibacillus jepli TaxID=3035914 RepID=A0ABU5CKJ5_9BACI|nr:PRD domain-containing protein [Virgibacillus sp. 179-BFC.A HS]MDY0406831.1 PRD domain-containing protein [Virgibacillus sp. 179-BFC.A HS]